MNLKFQLPGTCFDVGRLMELNKIDHTFTLNNHQATSFRARTDSIIHHKTADGFWTESQTVQLPFKVDATTCKWDVLRVFYDQLEVDYNMEKAWYTVVNVNIQSSVKRETTMRHANVRIIGENRKGRKARGVGGGQPLNEYEAQLRTEALREKMRLEVFEKLAQNLDDIMANAESED